MVLAMAAHELASADGCFSTIAGFNWLPVQWFQDGLLFMGTAATQAVGRADTGQRA